MMYSENKLSPREILFCTETLAGKTVRQIADENYCAYKTVMTWKYRAFAKLGVKSVAELFRMRIQDMWEHPPLMPSFYALEGYQIALRDLLNGN